MTDLDFSIPEIEEERTSATLPVLDGCDICMHCQLIRDIRSRQSPKEAPASPWAGGGDSSPERPAPTTSASPADSRKAGPPETESTAAPCASLGASRDLHSPSPSSTPS